MEHKRTGPEEWLIVTRRPLSDDRMLEARASGDATDDDGRYRHHYYLTPTEGGGVTFKEPSLGELARVIKAGPASRQASNEAKARWVWMSIKFVPGKAGITTWRCRCWRCGS
jgi:hypothetical protein